MKMKNNLFTLIMIVALSAVACNDVIDFENRIVDQAPPKTECYTNAECPSRAICRLDEYMTDNLQRRVKYCVEGCSVTFTDHSDGTRTKSEDTCQRFGDEGLFCSTVNYTCHGEENGSGDADADVDGDADTDADSDTDSDTDCPDPDPDPDPVGRIEVGCWYPAQVDGDEFFGQMAWSESTASNPEAWAFKPDLSISGDGYMAIMVHLDLVTADSQTGWMFYVDLTRGPREDNLWVGSAVQPTNCIIDGEQALMGAFEPMRGWPFRVADAQ